ncbi:MAG TPA: hypothetical protein VGM66_07275 [Candidatus Udaeobacter sp.]|jgi:hypothetical protein
MNRKYLFCVAALLLPAFALAEQPKEASLVEQAIKEYVRSQAHVKVHIEHLRIVGNFASATAAPINADRDSVKVFMKKVRQQWIGVSFGTAFLPADCLKLGLPSEICP